uniref:Carotene biosynthesis-related protein n=1 Tax=Haematococcus lacustris TaxID=44745 RepID=Q2KNZ3_HAELA|nr:carotene biosynthesis-related protein [Haematococcus lacustris]
MSAMMNIRSSRPVTQATPSRPARSALGRRCTARAASEDVPVTEAAPIASTSSPADAPARSVAAPFSLLNATNEAINGRAAMLGFVAAVGAELASHQGIVSQVAGRYDNAELVEKALRGSDLGFFAIVSLVTMGTLAPRLLENEAVDARSFGPFTPGLEKTLGRAAMMGFAGVLLIELAKGSPLL